MKNSISLLTFILLSTIVFSQQPERFSDEKKENQNVSTPEETPEKVDATTNSSKTTSSRNGTNNIIDKLRFGGNFSLGFGSYTFVNVSPRVHYLIQDNFAVGSGFSYYYWKDNRDYPPNYNFKTSGNTWGLNLFSWYNPFGPITLQAEYEPLNFEVYQGYYDDPASGTRNYVYDREWVHALFLGGGIRQQSGRGNFFMMALYDVLYDVNRSFYSSPWQIRVGVGF
jgi:hypothetical protein